MIDGVLNLRDIVFIVVAVGGVFGVMFKFSVNRILLGIAEMRTEIKTAHAKIDGHVKDAHKDDSLVKKSIDVLDGRMKTMEDDVKEIDHLVRDLASMSSRRNRDKKA